MCQTSVEMSIVLKGSKSKGKLTKRLLEEGLVTKEQMKQLKQEMKDDSS